MPWLLPGATCQTLLCPESSCCPAQHAKHGHSLQVLSYFRCPADHAKHDQTLPCQRSSHCPAEHAKHDHILSCPGVPAVLQGMHSSTKTLVNIYHAIRRVLHPSVMHILSYSVFDKFAYIPIFVLQGNGFITDPAIISSTGISDPNPFFTELLTPEQSFWLLSLSLRADLRDKHVNNCFPQEQAVT